MARTKSSISLSTAVTGHLRYVSATYSDATHADYSHTHRSFLEFTGDLPLRDIEPAHIEAYLAHMRTTPIAPAGVMADHKPARTRRRRPKTIANLHIGLSALWSWAVRRGYADENVVRHVPRPKAPPEPIVPLSQTDVVKLLRACNESRPWRSNPLVSNRRSSAERDKAIIGLLVETAIRATELCNLRYGHLTFHKHGGQVYVDLGKGNKSRSVPFSRRCAGLLNDYLLTRPDIADMDPLFVNTGRNAGLPLTRGNLLKLLKRLGRKAGVQVSPHLLRTTAACMMVSNGVTAWQLQAIMGHADIATTMRYVRAANIDLDAAMRRASPLDNLRL